MKLGIANGGGMCDGWEDGDGNTAHTQAHILAVEEPVSHTLEERGEEDDTDLPVPTRSHTRARRRETLTY